MRYIFTILSIIAFHMGYSQESSDSTEIVYVLKEDYKTMVTHDINKHKSFCTDDYLLIENGEIWNMEREAIDYRKKAHTVIQRFDYFDFKYFKIENSTAYAVYGLKSDITESGKLTTRYWNESAIFRKVDGSWKIALIHSTPIVSK
jgi:hypothetical protein